MVATHHTTEVFRNATARIGYDRRGRPAQDRVLDISIKSASTPEGKLMAPEWPLVRDFKEGSIDWEMYTEKYHELLRKRYARYAQVFHDLIRDVVTGGERLVLTCYCNVGPGCEECHRFLMADILEKIAEQEGYEVCNEGDLSQDRAPQPSPQLPLGL